MFPKRLGYELRVAFGLTSLLPLPGLAGFALLEGLINPKSSLEFMQPVTLRDFTLFLPLIAGLSVAHLMSVDKDEGFDELRKSYPEPLYRQALWRTLIAFLLMGAASGLGWAAYSLILGEAVPLQWILPAFPPTLYLMGLSLVVDHASGSYWAAAGTTLTYWLLEVQSQVRGKLTGDLFLFQAVWDNGINGSWNTILLCLVGSIFLLVNILIGQFRLNKLHTRERILRE
jgi:hypothetical protein